MMKKMMLLASVVALAALMLAAAPAFAQDLKLQRQRIELVAPGVRTRLRRTNIVALVAPHAWRRIVHRHAGPRA